jgi:hypothetical protein
MLSLARTTAHEKAPPPPHPPVCAKEKAPSDHAEESLRRKARPRTKPTDVVLSSKRWQASSRLGRRITGSARPAGAPPSPHHTSTSVAAVSTSARMPREPRGFRVLPTILCSLFHGATTREIIENSGKAMAPSSSTYTVETSISFFKKKI